MLAGTDRILITGGAGLVGSHIADLLIKQCNPEIIIFDNFSTGKRENLSWALRNGRVEIVEGDIRDTNLLFESMNNVDIVFHQADIQGKQCVEDPRLAFEVMAEGTFNLLAAAALNRVRKIVAASSATAYSAADRPYRRSLHGTVKAFNEGLLHSFRDLYGAKYVALRYYDVYGPRVNPRGNDAGFLISWMEGLARRQPCVISGDGSQTRDFVYVGDVARANVLAASSNVSDEVFDVASGTETSLNDVAGILGRMMGANVPPRYQLERERNAVPRKKASTREAEHLIGFRAQINLEAGLNRLMTWWERQRARAVAL